MSFWIIIKYYCKQPSNQLKMKYNVFAAYYVGCVFSTIFHLTYSLFRGQRLVLGWVTVRYTTECCEPGILLSLGYFTDLRSSIKLSSIVVAMSCMWCPVCSIDRSRFNIIIITFACCMLLISMYVNIYSMLFRVIFTYAWVKIMRMTHSVADPEDGSPLTTPADRMTHSSVAVPGDGSPPHQLILIYKNSSKIHNRKPIQEAYFLFQVIR